MQFEIEVTMATRKKVVSRPTPRYTTTSCGLCPQLDTDDMVACDKCSKWFHFDCVGVTQEIVNVDWNCNGCRIQIVETVSSRGMRKSLPSTSSRSSSTMTSKQKRVALMQLEEEQAIRLAYINRKYEILGCDDEDGSDDEPPHDEPPHDRTYSMSSLVVPLQNLTLESTKFQQERYPENVNPTASDEERELCNKMDFNDSHRVHLNSVRNSYEEKRNSAVNENMNFHPCTKNETFTPGAASIGQNESVQQPPMGRKEFQKLNSKHSPDYNQQCMSATRMKQPEIILKQTNPIIGQTKRVQLPPIHQHQQLVGCSAMENPTDGMMTSHPNCNLLSKASHQQRPSNVGNPLSPYAQSHQTHVMQQPNSQSESRTAHMQQSQMNLNSSFGMGFNQPYVSNFQRSEQLQTNMSDNRQLPSNEIEAINKDSSGYVGYTGELTSTHIAARHVFSKDLPQFWGQPKEWPMFLSSLKNSTAACGFSDGENLGRLQRCLKGDVMDMMRSHLLHASSVQGVVETLHMMFGRPSMIIHSLLEEIENAPAPKADDLSSLIRFAIAVRSLSATIKNSGNLEYLRNPLLIQSITDKLPTQTRLNWASFKHGAGDVDLAMMGDWLFHLAQVATEVINPSLLKIGDKKDRKNRNHQNDSCPSTYVNAHSDDGDSKKFKCRGCNTDAKHTLDSCKKFKELSVEERWNFIKKHKLCGSCFGFHKFYKCLKKKKCGAGGCIREHHILLHNAIDNSPSKTIVSTGSQNVATTNAHRTVSLSKYPDIFRIVPVILSYKEKSIRIFAYLDDGSNLTSLEESVARKLNVFGTKEPLCVKWSFGNRETLPNSRQLTVKIRGVDEGAEEYVLNHVRTVKKLMLPTQSITKDWLAQYSHFDDVPITTYTDATPQMIIGLEYSKLMVSLETREADWSQPLVCKTRIGWVVQGPNNGDMDISKAEKYSLNMCECHSSDKNLHQLVNDFFSAENLDVNVPVKMLETSSKVITVSLSTRRSFGVIHERCCLGCVPIYENTVSS